jgi:hypothetical protein
VHQGNGTRSRTCPVPSASAAPSCPKSARLAGDPFLLLKEGSPSPAGIQISSPAGILSHQRISFRVPSRCPDAVFSGPDCRSAVHFLSAGEPSSLSEKGSSPPADPFCVPGGSCRGSFPTKQSLSASRPTSFPLARPLRTGRGAGLRRAPFGSDFGELPSGLTSASSVESSLRVEDSRVG